MHFISGRRDVALNFNGVLDTGKNNYVNFSCNPFFNLFGRSVLYCLNGVWETEIPQCALRTDICLIKPQYKIGKSQIVSLTHAVINNEYDQYGLINKTLVYTYASYTCNNNQFDPSYDPSQIQYKFVSNRKIGFVNVSCIGKELWEEVKCA